MCLCLRHPSLALALALGGVAGWATTGCSAPKVEPAPPPSIRMVESSIEPAPSRPVPKVPDDAFSVGTFNLDWAFDSVEDERSKWAIPYIAPDEAAWNWKRNRIVDVLIAEQLDIVVLTEIGGRRELYDIVSSVHADMDGPDYGYAWVEGEDHLFGKQVAILSRFPIHNQRRTSAYAPIHVAADIELPTGHLITVIGMHLKEGRNEGAVHQRWTMARSLKRRTNREAKKNPVLVLGTLGDPTLPGDEGYDQSAAGMFAGEPTSIDGDDCLDSGAEPTAQLTALGEHGGALDRIFSCGLEMRGAGTSGGTLIVRQQRDPSGVPWPSVPVDSEPHRDVSDHLVLWAEIGLPEDDDEVEFLAQNDVLEP